MNDNAWKLSEMIDDNDDSKLRLCEIFNMIHQNPNNMELGKRLRQYYHNLLETTEYKITTD